MNRPGITPEFLDAAGVRHVSASEALNLSGASRAGLWIPYRSIAGEPVVRADDSPQGYGRLRLDVPLPDGGKYHQRKGSKPYAYLPHNLHELTAQTDLVIVEGEFKAMALAEAGIAAVGVGGITMVTPNDQLVAPLDVLIRERMNVQRVLFLGDGDTSLIFQFSREALKLADKLKPIPILLPRIGLDGPGKGIDDCRENSGAEFPAYWAQLVKDAEPVNPGERAEDLAVRLFKREAPEALKKHTAA